MIQVKPWRAKIPRKVENRARSSPLEHMGKPRTASGLHGARRFGLRREARGARGAFHLALGLPSHEQARACQCQEDMEVSTAYSRRKGGTERQRQAHDELNQRGMPPNRELVLVLVHSERRVCRQCRSPEHATVADACRARAA